MLNFTNLPDLPEKSGSNFIINNNIRSMEIIGAGLLQKIPGLPATLDNLDNIRKRDKPVFDVRYLRSESDDENFNYGALKLKISNQSDQAFTIDAIHIHSINEYKDFTESGGSEKMNIQAQDFEDVRLDFRYRGENIFKEGENTAVIRYHIESAKESSWHTKEVTYEDDSDIETI